MDVSPSKPALAKQLKDHLQEHQEPFKLTAYLFERRNTLKKSSSNAENDRRSLRNCTGNLKEPWSSSSLRKKLTSQSPKNLKSLQHKILAPSDKQLPSAANIKAVQEKVVCETIGMIQYIAETNWFSTASDKVDSLSAASDDCYGSLVEETSPALVVKHLKAAKTDIASHHECGSQKGNEQLILEAPSQALTSSQGNSNSSSSLSEANREPLLSAFLLKPLVKSLAEKHIHVRLTRAMERVDSGEIKRVLSPSKRTLLDCITQSVTSDIKNYKRQKHLHKHFNLEELGSIISRQLHPFGKQLVNATNAAQVINLELPSTAEEWNYFQQTKGQICREMGDAITDEIISEIIYLQ